MKEAIYLERLIDISFILILKYITKLWISIYFNRGVKAIESELHQ